MQAGRPPPIDVTDSAHWSLAELRKFNADRAAYLASVGERCGVPRMNSFVHALDVVDELDGQPAIRPVAASELCRQMITWATERRANALRRLDSERPAPLSMHHRGIPYDRGAPREARTWLVAIMKDHDDGAKPWRADIVADAALCMNELVIAAWTTGSTALALSVTLSATALRMSVQGEARRDVVNEFDLNRPVLHAQLMSFRIVNELADDWGADVVASVRVLWAEFALHDATTRLGPKNDLAGTGC